jgi:uncharacterized RDD family membrane protein YckC
VIFRRLAAVSIDTVTVGIPAFALGTLVSRWGAHSVVVALLVTIAVYLGAEIVLQRRAGAHAGQSVGKQLLGLRVGCRDSDRTPSTGRLIAREFLRWPLGILSLYHGAESFSRPETTWHDKLLKTEVTSADGRGATVRLD